MSLFHVSHRRARATGGTFSNHWFLDNQGQFERHLAHLSGTPCRLLEIGCYEGQATTWLLKYIATHSASSVTCVDVAEHPQFRRNVETEQGAERVKMIVGRSNEVLSRLTSRFDLIYVDGSHATVDVLEDAIWAWRLAKQSAIIAFDDYLWKEDGTCGGEGAPKLAIDTFIKIYRRKITILAKNYQLWVRKDSM